MNIATFWSQASITESAIRRSVAPQNQIFIVLSPVLWLLLTPSHKAVFVVVLCFGPGFSSPESLLSGFGHGGQL